MTENAGIENVLDDDLQDEALDRMDGVAGAKSCTGCMAGCGCKHRESTRQPFD